MPAEPLTVAQPKYPLHALTTYELRDYRRELEHSLKLVPEHTAALGQIKERLAEVLAEQESRMAIATGGRR
jgi:hypothetical protein